MTRLMQAAGSAAAFLIVWLLLAWLLGAGVMEALLPGLGTAVLFGGGVYFFDRRFPRRPGD